MLYIKDEIEYLLRLIETPPKEASTTLYYRMHVWGIIAVFNRVNRELECISSDLDTKLNLEAARLDFEKYYTQAHLNESDFKEKLAKCWSKDSNQTEINRMTDYLPNGESNYDVNPDILNSFKGAMHQLCDEERISTRVLIYALNKGYGTMISLLNEIQCKVSNPQPHLFGKFWREVVSTHIDGLNEKQFKGWLQDIVDPTIEDLISKQKQVIFEFLKKDFFRYCNNPSGTAVKNCKLKISEDDLEYGTKIPEDFPKECARLEKFFKVEEGCIAVLDYEKLGQYIYRHFNELEEDELYTINGFDRTIDLINEEIIRIKPSLAKYSKRYAEKELKALLYDCRSILAPFKAYLKDGIRQTLIDEYLEKLLFDSDLKEEAKNKLSGQSRNKYLVSIIRALSDSYIFKPKFLVNELAKTLEKSLGLESKGTIRRYFNNKDTLNIPLREWTANIMDELKEHPYNSTEIG